jgi:hypothetical protein
MKDLPLIAEQLNRSINEGRDAIRTGHAASAVAPDAQRRQPR